MHDVRALLREYDRARAYTDELWKDLSPDEVTWRPHENLSAIGWHLGHQAHVAHFMICNLTAAEPSPDPALGGLMDSALPEQFRGALPTVRRLSAFRDTVAERVHARIDAVTARGRQLDCAQPQPRVSEYAVHCRVQARGAARQHEREVESGDAGGRQRGAQLGDLRAGADERAGHLAVPRGPVTQVSGYGAAIGSQAGGNSDASSNSPRKIGHAIKTPPAPADG
jgi:DinB superfamily